MVAFTSGANMNFDCLQVVTELADVGAPKEPVLATFMPEEPGPFKKFQEMVGPKSITEFKYRYTSEEALVLYSLGLHKDEELLALKERMEGAGMRTMNLTNNDLAKDHLRHLMVGRSHVEHELLYRFVFPERQGALMKFLETFSPNWNITLFHYRSQLFSFSTTLGAMIGAPSSLQFAIVPAASITELLELPNRFDHRNLTLRQGRDGNGGELPPLRLDVDPLTTTSMHRCS